MIKNILIFCSIFPFVQGFSQVGILTTTPTNTLDVNGTLRVREPKEATVITNGTYYANKPLAQVNNGARFLTRNSNGGLQKQDTYNLLFSSGLLIQKINTAWSGILIGDKAARLDFSGRYQLSNINIFFSILYNPNDGSITILPEKHRASIIVTGANTFDILNSKFTVEYNTSTKKATIRVMPNANFIGSWKSVPIL